MMKLAFAPLALFLGVEGVVLQGHEQPFTYRPMWETFGNVTVEQMSKSRRRRDVTKIRSADPDYYTQRVQENCTFPFEIMFLQDATGSFQPDFLTTVGQVLPQLADFLGEDHPLTTFSLISFADKPIETLGETDDVCFTVELIDAVDATDMGPAYAQINPGGGYDWSENQFGAMVAALESPTSIPWMSNPLASRVIIDITDAGPHYARDDVDEEYPGLVDFGTEYDESIAEEFCLGRYYPSPFVVADAFLNTGVYFSAIVVRPEEHAGLALRSWQWFNSLVGQDETFVMGVDEDPTGWLQAIYSLIAAIRNEECGIGSTGLPSEPSSPQLSSHEMTTPSSPGTTTPLDTESSPETLTSRSVSTATVAATSSAGPSSATAGTSSASVVPTATPGPGSTVGTSETTEECDCIPPFNPDCCYRQPEVLIALLKRPKEFDLHMVNN